MTNLNEILKAQVERLNDEVQELIELNPELARTLLSELIAKVSDNTFHEGLVKRENERKNSAK